MLNISYSFLGRAFIVVSVLTLLIACGGKKEKTDKAPNQAISDPVTAPPPAPAQTPRARKKELFEFIQIGMSVSQLSPLLDKIGTKSARYQFGPHWRSDLNSPSPSGGPVVWLHSVKVVDGKIARVGVVWDKYYLSDQVPTSDPHGKFVASLREGDPYNKLVERLERLDARIFTDWEFSDIVDGTEQRFRITAEGGNISDKKVLPTNPKNSFAEY